MSTIKNRISSFLQDNILPSLGRGMGVGLLLLGLGMTSCEDMLDKGNDYVIYTEDHLIDNAARDTVTSVVGILNKLQAIAVRNNLMGEVRADLVTVTDVATTDIKNIASLDIDDDNAYNVPRDYYAVINNCNYYLANADSLAGNAKSGITYFGAEIAQVHSIRAWTYLQLVLLYGKVPFVTEPVLTKLESEAQYPSYGLEEICQYFIDDLKPYYGWEYPDYRGFDSDFLDPKICFFPTQLVMGDLYLWLAAKRQDPEMAKLAAKAYYDYIVWDRSGKTPLTTTADRVSWPTSDLNSGGSLLFPSGNLGYSPYGKWGTEGYSQVTAIPMDSAAAEGFYNDLQYIYNSQPMGRMSIEKEASLIPSQVLRSISQKHDYVGLNSLNRTVRVTADRFTEEQLSNGYYGDLRYQANLTRRTGRSSLTSQDATYQLIWKHSYRHISVYRAAQIYLRLAEALNYAGYPRFARQILTTGLDYRGILYEVQPYYTTAADSAFIDYFYFSSYDFVSYIRDYEEKTNPYGIVVGYEHTGYLTGENDKFNMWGIHGRGSGIAFLDDQYAVLHAVDSTSYPRTEEASVGTEPDIASDEYKVDGKKVNKPSTWDAYPGETVSYEVYITLNHARNASTLETKYQDYVANDSVGAYQAVYDRWLADYLAYQGRLGTYMDKYYEWYRNAYGNKDFIWGEQVDFDQLILDEQALELSYEGNRFYDLMRRAYWYKGTGAKDADGDLLENVLAKSVGKRDAAAGSKLASEQNWFIRWKGKIGL